MVRFFEVFLKNDRGATSIEYGLLACLISIAVLAAVQILPPGIRAVFGRAEGELKTVTQATGE